MATLGCIQAKMGRTTYYICKMAAGELTDKVGIAKEPPEWSDMTAEEKMQRECDIKRIIEEIVPYVTDDPDRFFSSLIVDIYSGFDEIRFEPLSKVVGNIPDAYAVPMADMGFITLPGKERLITLDGQAPPSELENRYQRYHGSSGWYKDLCCDEQTTAPP